MQKKKNRPLKIAMQLLLSHFCHVCLFKTPWTVARQASQSVGFSRQEYWSGFPCPPPGDLPNPGIKPSSPVAPELAGRFFTTSTVWEAHILYLFIYDIFKIYLYNTYFMYICIIKFYLPLTALGRKRGIGQTVLLGECASW